MPTCPKCGAYNPDSYEFCSRCGELLVTADDGNEKVVHKTGGPLRYALIAVSVVGFVIGIYTLFGLQMDWTDDLTGATGSMSAFGVVTGDWVAQNFSSSGTVIVFALAVLLCVIGLMFPLATLISSAAMIGLACITDTMFATYRSLIDASHVIFVDTSTMLLLGAVGVLLSLVGIALWFAVVVRGPCANRTFLEKVRYVWTGSYGDRFRARRSNL